MAREIKFRAKSDGRWVYGELHLMCRMPHIHCPDARPINTDTVGQFTGLHDKNGKEIYEGDIVLWERKRVHIEGRPVQDFSDVCKIYYDEQKHAFCFWFKMSCGSASGLLNFNDDRAESSSIEIIGNIYDNPELLTKEA